LESYPLPQNGVAWRHGRGCIGLWAPCPVLFVMRMQGHGHAEFAAAILEAYHTLKQHTSIHVFVDAELLESYDSRLRTELTAGFLPDRGRLVSFHVLLRSKIVAMGISVANLALGGIVHTTNDARKFRETLDGCLFQNHVVGFSPGALDTLRPRASANG
jgi:hypothetical protein